MLPCKHAVRRSPVFVCVQAGLLDSLLSLHSATIFVPADSVLRHTALACLSPTELRTFMEHHIVDELPFSHPFYVEQPAGTLVHYHSPLAPQVRNVVLCAQRQSVSTPRQEPPSTSAAMRATSPSSRPYLYGHQSVTVHTVVAQTFVRCLQGVIKTFHTVMAPVLLSNGVVRHHRGVVRRSFPCSAACR